MGLLDDIAADDMQHGFMNIDEHAETITYTPRGGVALTFPAVVNRLEPDPLDGPGQSGPVIEVAIQRSSNNALGVNSINKGGDKITIAPRKGGANKPMSIAEIIEQDETAWLVRLR